MNRLTQANVAALATCVLAACGTSASSSPTPLNVLDSAVASDAGISDAQLPATARTIRGKARTVSGAPPKGAIVHLGKMTATVDAKGEFELADAWPAADATYDLVVACFAPESGQSERPCEGVVGSKYDGSLNIFSGLASTEPALLLDTNTGGAVVGLRLESANLPAALPSNARVSIAPHSEFVYSAMPPFGSSGAIRWAGSERVETRISAIYFQYGSRKEGAVQIEAYPEQLFAMAQTEPLVLSHDLLAEVTGTMNFQPYSGALRNVRASLPAIAAPGNGGTTLLEYGVTADAARLPMGMKNKLTSASNIEFSVPTLPNAAESTAFATVTLSRPQPDSVTTPYTTATTRWNASGGDRVLAVPSFQTLAWANPGAKQSFPIKLRWTGAEQMPDANASVRIVGKAGANVHDVRVSIHSSTGEAVVLNPADYGFTQATWNGIEASVTMSGGSATTAAADGTQRTAGTAEIRASLE